MTTHYNQPAHCAFTTLTKPAEADAKCYNENFDTEDQPLCHLPPPEPKKEHVEMMPMINRSETLFANTMESHANAIKTITLSADEDQKKNTESLEIRRMEIDTWRGNEKNLISMLREEKNFLEEQKWRVRRADKALQFVESAIRETINRRAHRVGPDLVHDCVDTAVHEADQLCRDLRRLYEIILAEVNSLLETIKICKVQLEFDWSDKSEAHHLEKVNVESNNKGPVLFYPGASRLPANQSTAEHWLHYTKELISQGKKVLSMSQALRERVNKEISKAVDDIIKISDNVALCFQRNLATTEKDLKEAEDHLTATLNKISTVEGVAEKLLRLARQLDFNVKTAQTRLNNRNDRPRAENTRDCRTHSLIEELKHLNEDAAIIKKELDDAKETLRSLFNARSIIEERIFIKRKSIYIDRLRCMPCWSKIPESSVLMGFTE